MIRIAPLLICWPLLFSTAAAQRQSTSGKTATVTAHKLTELKATGTKRYTDGEILAASGLEIGQNAADGDFKEAVRRLGDSGLFSDIVYTYSSLGAGVKLDLQLTDIDDSKLVPAHFENFVWFSDDELVAGLQRRVPLFKKLLPLTGTLSGHVSEALQVMLAEKHLPGRVVGMPEAKDQSGGSIIGIGYRVEDVSIRIHGFEFPGATPEQATLLARAARGAIGGPYDRSVVAAVAAFDLLPVYLQRGFLKAKFGPSDAHIVPPPARAPDSQNSAELQVDAIVPVTPGQAYATAGIDWKGNLAIPISDLAPLLHLPSGQPADAVRLAEDVKAVEKLYRSRGYMTAQIKPETRFDDEKSTVHYDLNIVEGDLYKMGELEINGLDTQAKARMAEAWKLREGQPYDADYLQKYLRDTGPLLPRGVRWGVTVHETPDAKDKTVDVEIRFKQE